MPFKIALRRPSQNTVDSPAPPLTQIIATATSDVQGGGNHADIQSSIYRIGLVLGAAATIGAGASVRLDRVA